MNTLKTLEKSQGTRSGHIDDVTWRGNIKVFFDTANDKFNEMRIEMLKAGLMDWDKLHKMAMNCSQSLKGLGFMRMAFILDTMQKAVSPERVAMKNPDLNRY